MTELPSILRKILATKAEEVAAGAKLIPLTELAAQAADMPPCRGFYSTLKAVSRERPAVIAEIKKASPSAGEIRADFQPAEIARSYQQAGAACLSVLTDRDYFQGHNDYLTQARNAASLPLLRKDFMINDWHIYESRCLGADAVLLIVAALDDDRLAELCALAMELGMDVLVEVHNEGELQRALALPSPLLGINNRDLHHFVTDLATTERLAPLVSGDRLIITESGIHTPADVRRMQAAGVNAFLVGESLMREDQIELAYRSLFTQ